MSDTRPFRELLFWDFTDVTLASRDTWWSVIKHIRLLESILWTQRRCPKCWECWSPCVSQGPAGALQWGLDHDVISSQFMLLRDHIGARPSPLLFPLLHQANIASPPQNQPKGVKNKNKARRRKGECERNKKRTRDNEYEEQLENPCKHLMYWSLNFTHISLFLDWGQDDQVRQWGGHWSHWCQGSVREIGSGRVFLSNSTLVGITPPSRTIVYLSCYYLTVTPNWMGDLIQCWGARNIKPCLLLGE